MRLPFLLSVGLCACLAQSAKDSFPEYVQIVDVEAQPVVLAHTCGKALVRVLIVRNETTPLPKVLVSLFHAGSSNPELMQITVLPEQQPLAVVPDSNRGVATFTVCSTGSVEGTATLQAVIASVSPGPPYGIHEPEPDERGRVTFTVLK